MKAAMKSTTSYRSACTLGPEGLFGLFVAIFLFSACAVDSDVDPVFCTGDFDCPTGFCDTENAACVECITDAQCGLGGVCESQVCMGAPCAGDDDCPGALVCSGERCAEEPPIICAPRSVVCDRNDVVTCSSDGYSLSRRSCGSAAECISGACVDIDFCDAGTRECVGDSYLECLADGRTRSEPVECNTGAGLYCAQGDCLRRVCEVGTRRCNWNLSRIVYCIHDDVGEGFEESCAGGNVCTEVGDQAYCRTACDTAADCADSVFGGACLNGACGCAEDAECQVDFVCGSETTCVPE